jgi:hypothetical protein
VRAACNLTGGATKPQYAFGTDFDIARPFLVRALRRSEVDNLSVNFSKTAVEAQRARFEPDRKVPADLRSQKIQSKLVR